MRRRTEKTASKKKKILAPKASVNSAIDEKSKCNHCGGLLRLLPDDASCINCGRLANHQCEMCLYGRKDVVA